MKDSITTLWRFIIVPLKSTGNIISRIKYNKKNVSLFFNKDKVNISFDAYSLNYLYVGKILSRKEIQELIDFSATDEALKKAMSLLKRGHYSEFKMREKLKEKEYDSKTINTVIKFLKNNDLINDEMLANDYLEYYNEKNFGKLRIVYELQNKGIFDVTINKLKFPETLEKEKALNQLEILNKKYASFSYNKKKEKIYSSLVGLGFESSVVTYAINKIKAKDERKENDNLARDYNLLYSRLSRRYEDEELKEKLFKALRNKGYRYKDIQQKMEDKFI